MMWPAMCGALTIAAFVAAASACGAEVVRLANDSETWTATSYDNRLQIECAKNFHGGDCVYVGGPTAKCDTAWSAVSRKIPIPAGSKFYEVTFETFSEKWCTGLYRDGWDAKTALVWQDSSGQERAEHFRMFLPRGDFSSVVVRGAIPDSAVSVALRLALDVPDMAPGECFAFRNATFSFAKMPTAGKPYEVRRKPMPLGDLPVRKVDVGRLPETPPVTLRQDGMALVDGKPFFPIGMFGLVKHEINGRNYDRAFGEIAAAGFNMAYSWGETYHPGFLDAAEKYGVKLFVRTRPPDRELIEKGRYHPAIISWYIGDDTCDFFTPEQLLANQAAIRKLDPTRITCQADGIGDLDLCEDSKYCDYVNATDVFMPEIYPILDTNGVRNLTGSTDDVAYNARCVAEVIRTMKRVRKDVMLYGDGAPRACWPIIQYFSGWGSSRFPTPDEVKAMSFAALVYGANGISWYTYVGFNNPRNKGATSTPERWKTLCDLAGWIRELSPALLSGESEHPRTEVLAGNSCDPLGQGPSVTALLKRMGGEAWLLAVNAAKAPVRIRFRLTGVSGTAVVDREGRTVCCPDGVLEDEFPPFGVHVYMFGRQVE